MAVQRFRKSIAGTGFQGLEELVKNLEAIGKDVSRIEPAFVAVDYRIAPHAHLVEYGARGGQMPATPYFRPGLDMKKTEAFQRIGKQVGELIEGKQIDPEEIIFDAAKIINAEQVRMAPERDGRLKRGLVVKRFKK